MTFVVGLTGGIASGKSTVSSYLNKQGFTIIDADRVARKVVAPNTPGLRRIRQTFGPKVLNADGRLNRQRLGEIIFHSQYQRDQLNQIVQPLIRQQIVGQIHGLQQQGVALAVLDAPLLFEEHYETLCNQIMVVTVSEDVQLRRLMKRNALSTSDAQARINSQMPLLNKVQKADVVIDNSCDLSQTYRQVDKWLATLA